MRLDKILEITTYIALPFTWICIVFVTWLMINLIIGNIPICY